MSVACKVVTDAVSSSSDLRATGVEGASELTLQDRVLPDSTREVTRRQRRESLGGGGGGGAWHAEAESDAGEARSGQASEQGGAERAEVADRAHGRRGGELT
eukprot:3744898-Rhodomonas_salina.1